MLHLLALFGSSQSLICCTGWVLQALNVSPRSSELGVTDSAQLDRASVSLRAGHEPSARDLLRAATFDTQASESLSVCAEDGLVPGLPNQSLRVLLSSDPLITGAREDFEGASPSQHTINPYTSHSSYSL